MKQFKKAFSLIEISIVILVIGILVAGVTQASKLIDKMTLTSAQALTQSSPVAGIKGLAAWYESTSEKSFSSTIDQDSSTNNAVTVWNDINPQSTSTFNASPLASNNQPILKKAAINNLPAVFFDGVNDYLAADSLASYFSGEDLPISVFVVLNKMGSAAAQQNFISFSNSSATDPLIWFPITSGACTISRRSEGIIIASPSIVVTSNKAQILSFVSSGTTASGYLNGATMFSGSPSDVPTTSLNQFSIGAISRITPQYFFNGAIGEIIIFNRALTDEERLSIDRYLGKKWSIQVS
ncbi:MAG: prepilin-type N-terminal cleavage/methylation domain-containing protein [Rickettsiales bacterium]|nr:prepilin-type N-terminal cleavage/methylation domain-containing protein [Rickettsiales bacterium]